MNFVDKNGTTKVSTLDRLMPIPRELPQQNPAPWQKLGCKSPRVGGNFFGANPVGYTIMDKIDTCIRVVGSEGRWALAPQ